MTRGPRLFLWFGVPAVVIAAGWLLVSVGNRPGVVAEGEHSYERLSEQVQELRSALVEGFDRKAEIRWRQALDRRMEEMDHRLLRMEQHLGELRDGVPREDRAASEEPEQASSAQPAPIAPETISEMSESALVSSARLESKSGGDPARALSYWRAVRSRTGSADLEREALLGIAGGHRRLKQYEDEERALAEAIRLAGPESAEGLKALFLLAHNLANQRKFHAALRRMETVVDSPLTEEPRKGFARLYAARFTASANGDAAAAPLFEDIIATYDASSDPGHRVLVQQARAGIRKADRR